MSRFQYFDGIGSQPPGDLPLQATEHPIGVYINVQGSLENSIIITDLSLILEQGGAWSPIPYEAICKVLSPQTKVNVPGLDLLLRDGATVHLPLGGSSRFSDAFEFLRFLRRVLEDRLSDD